MEENLRFLFQSLGCASLTWHDMSSRIKGLGLHHVQSAFESPLDGQELPNVIASLKRECLIARVRKGDVLVNLLS